MKTYKITYYAPYGFANFTCEAESIEEARNKLDWYNNENGYCISRREIKTETFGGKRV